MVTLVFSNGMTLTVTDAARILNTGGVDREACSPGAGEGAPWTSVAAANVTRTP